MWCTCSIALRFALYHCTRFLYSTIQYNSGLSIKHFIKTFQCFSFSHINHTKHQSILIKRKGLFSKVLCLSSFYLHFQSLKKS